MKVLHLLSSTGYHGAENVVTELVHQLSTLGVTNHLGLFFGQENTNREIIEAAGGYVDRSTVFPCSGRLDIKTVSVLRSYIKEHGFDVVHSHKYKTNLYCLLAASFTGVKLVSTCHNWLGESVKMRMYARLDKLILKRFDAAVGVSDEVAAELGRHMDPGKVYKIGNGVNLSRFYRVSGREDAKRSLGLEGKKVIGFVGRLSADKGVSYLLGAVKGLMETDEDINTIIVGDGEHGASLKEEAASLGITDRVVFTGRRGDTPLIYSAMDVFVLPSLKEAFPMVVLEAMSCGLPVVATSVGDIPGIIEENVTGFVVKPGSAGALEGPILSLLSDRRKREAMGKAAGEAAVAKFSSEEMARRYMKIYDKVTDSG